MKKFIIISTILILLAAGAFGYSLYHYMSVTGMLDHAQPAAATSATEVQSATEGQNATEAPAAGMANSAGGSGFAASMSKASAYVDTLSKEQMVGQIILGVCSDLTTADAQMNQYSLAGMLFEYANFAGMAPEQVAQSMKTIREQAAIKPILAAQEEGGTYTTISDLPGYTEYDFNAPRYIFTSGGLQAVEKAELEKAEMLKTAGFNLNLAPVVDFCTDASQMMYSRSVGDDIDTVAAFAEYAGKFVQAKGVSVALKHFPGYGSIPTTYGYEAVEDDREAESIRNTDYIPFKKGAAAGAHFVMMSNVVVKNIDPAHTAALSPALHQELRDTVGFQGLIMTDLLDGDGMDYTAYADGKKPVVQAVLAGNDIIFVRDYATAYADILEAVNAGTVTEAQLKEACTRVIAYKYTAGIMS